MLAYVCLLVVYANAGLFTCDSVGGKPRACRLAGCVVAWPSSSLVGRRIGPGSLGAARKLARLLIRRRRRPQQARKQINIGPSIDLAGLARWLADDGA